MHPNNLLPIYTWVWFRIRLAHFPQYKNNYNLKNGLAYCEIALQNRTCKQTLVKACRLCRYLVIVDLWIECCCHWLVLFYCVYGTERDGNKCISIYWINMFLVCFICPNWFATVLTQRTCYNKCISTVPTSLQTQRKCIHLLCLLIVLSHSKLKRSNQKIEILCFFDIFKTSTRWNEG